jgi:hypothetical protein
LPECSSATQMSLRAQGVVDGRMHGQARVPCKWRRGFLHCHRAFHRYRQSCWRPVGMTIAAGLDFTGSLRRATRLRCWTLPGPVPLLLGSWMRRSQRSRAGGSWPGATNGHGCPTRCCVCRHSAQGARCAAQGGAARSATGANPAPTARQPCAKAARARWAADLDQGAKLAERDGADPGRS